MNVLVYSGKGATTESIKHTIESLRLHLSPYYAVVTVSESALLNDPWMFKTACLVIPGGADLPYCKVLNGPGNERIKQYVRKGGKYIGFCAGAYYASSRCEFEVGTPMEVSGPRELGFYPGTIAGTAYSGFLYESHHGARATPLAVNLPDVSPVVYNYYNGGGVFVNAAKLKGVEVLASYTEPLDVQTSGSDDMAAAVYCKVGKGDVLLTGTHPEFAASLMKPSDDDLVFKSVTSVLLDPDTDLNRKRFLQGCLKKIGLKVNEDVDVSIPKLTPVFVGSLLPDKATELLGELKEKLDFIGNTVEDKNDTLVFHDESENDHEYIISSTAGETIEFDNLNSIPKHFKVFSGTNLPDPNSTPYFNMSDYFTHLRELSANHTYKSFGFGSIIGYGEVVTSTNTLLDQNPGWLQHLPTGFVLTATTQVAGRGRGGNVWINPKGVMALSILFKVPNNTRQNSSIVTLQYLCGLAMIEAILSYGSTSPGTGVGYEDMPIKLKWPNDIYALKPEYYNQISDKDITNSTVEGDDEKYAKISGALINSQFMNKQFHLVWGCGVNVSNSAPTTSLNIVLDKLNAIRAAKGLEKLPPYRHELLLAKLMFIMDEFYSVFSHSGLKPFLPLYYKRWFHSDQTVKVDSGDGKAVRTCKIKGITPEYGLLMVEDVRNHEKLELQPDGNSFDIFKGLVYKKTQV